MNCAALQKEMITALGFYADCGVDACLLEETQDRFKEIEMDMSAPLAALGAERDDNSMAVSAMAKDAPALLGKSDAYDEAVKRAKSADSLEDLREIIADFDGISLKKTASNLVFSDGNPKADIMLIGEAPGADDDRAGKPFCGENGELLDRILACIGLDRMADTEKGAVYLSNILNWRPPGNRTPSPAEIEVSLPFIKRHIELAKPKMLILCGGITAKALLDSPQSISRLRKKWHDYPMGGEGSKNSIPAIVTYHPSYLISTPSQKKSVWADMLMVQGKINS